MRSQLNVNKTVSRPPQNPQRVMMFLVVENGHGSRDNPQHFDLLRNQKYGIRSRKSRKSRTHQWKMEMLHCGANQSTKQKTRLDHHLLRQRTICVIKRRECIKTKFTNSRMCDFPRVRTNSDALEDIYRNILILLCRRKEKHRDTDFISKEITTKDFNYIVEFLRHRAAFHEEDGAVRWQQYQTIMIREVRNEVYGVSPLQQLEKKVSAKDKSRDDNSWNPGGPLKPWVAYGS